MPGSNSPETELLRKNYDVIVYDDLSEGHREFVPDDAVFIQGNTRDAAQLERVFNRYPVDTVIHFAGFISMGESMRNPARYFHNNVGGTLVLLENMVRHGVLKIVFSSSAGVYGNPERIPIEEGDRTVPTNPYGESKLMIENCLKWYDICHGMKSISIRYFNAAGAVPEAGLGEAHRDESHIIPLAILTALGRRKVFTLFGTDYDTHDGTCVRDYIHVLDLAKAHVRAIEELQNSGIGGAFNAGTGHGYSNREIIDMVKNVTGIDFPVETVLRRPGDTDIMVASSQKIMDIFGWQPGYSSLENMVWTAYDWHKSELYGRLTDC